MARHKQGINLPYLEDEREAKHIAAKRTQLQREQSVRTQRHITLMKLEDELH